MWLVNAFILGMASFSLLCWEIRELKPAKKFLSFQPEVDILQYSELVHLLFWPSRLFKSKAKNITNLAASRYMKREIVSRSVDVLHSKTPLLQLRINESSKNSFWKHVINNTDGALYKEEGSKKPWIPVWAFGKQLSHFSCQRPLPVYLTRWLLPIR